MAGYASTATAPDTGEFPNIDIKRNATVIGGITWDELSNTGVLWIDDSGSTAAAIAAGDVITVATDGF